jgi:hypothetical protein
MGCGVDGTGTAGGHRMQTVKASGEVATASPRGKGKATALPLTTTLYELMAALQAVAALDDDALVVASVVHLLRSGRLTWLGTDGALRCPPRRQMMPPQPRAPCITLLEALAGIVDDPPNVRRGALAGSSSRQGCRGHQPPTVVDRRPDF